MTSPLTLCCFIKAEVISVDCCCLWLSIPEFASSTGLHWNQRWDCLCLLFLPRLSMYCNSLRSLILCHLDLQLITFSASKFKVYSKEKKSNLHSVIITITTFAAKSLFILLALGQMLDSKNVKTLVHD